MTEELKEHPGNHSKSRNPLPFLWLKKREREMLLFIVQSWAHPAGARTHSRGCLVGWDHGGKGCPVKFGATEETQPRKEAWPKAEQKGESSGSPPTHTLVFL